MSFGWNHIAVAANAYSASQPFAQREGSCAPALPAELIDRVSLCGPKERVAERLAVYRDAGVGTLMCTPMAFDAEGRTRMIRELAEIAA